MLAGAIVGDSNAASTFNGGTTGLVVATRAIVDAPDRFSLETWVRTSTTRGGKLFGFGNGSSGNSANFDRHVYMTNNGRLIFGVKPGGVQRTVTSAASYNDNQWHHVVATLSSAGMILYVDGAVVAQSAATTYGYTYNGWWRLGGDNLSSWPSQPTSGFLAGMLDDFAIYPTALSAAQVSGHYLTGRLDAAGQCGCRPLRSPRQVDDLAVDFDGTESADSDGTVQSYAWDFGDGSSGVGVSPSHDICGRRDLPGDAGGDR